MCVYVYMSYVIIYIYTTQIPKATKVLLPNLSTCIWGPRPTSFGHNVWSKPSSLGSTTVKVVLFYPLCHNISVFFLHLFTIFYHPACLQFRSRSTTSLPLPAVAACCSTAPAHRPRRPNSESRRLRRWLSRPSGWRPSSSLAWEIGSVVNLKFHYL